MDIVLLLGAGAEPAQSIARRLVVNGARVYGLANKFPEQGFAHRDFIPVGVNPADPAAMRAEVEKIVAREGAVGAVILAGFNPVEDAFEAAHPNDVALAVFAGLAAPLAAVRAALPGLIRRRGLVMAITRPVFGPGAALGGVVEAGLASFCDGLFGELRDTGVRVSHIRLQENAGPADPASRYSAAPQSRVQPDIVADTVETVMRLRENNAITRLVLRPQATREEPRLPVTAEPRLASLQVVQLPTSKNYPPAEEKIRTPEYRRPDYAPPPEDREESDEDEDESVDPELAYLIKPRHRDRFVRETPVARAEPVRNEPENSDEDDAGDEVQDENSAEGAAPVREERRDAGQAPKHRQEPRQEQNRYFNPYAPQQPKQKPPRHGALRIQAPATSEEEMRRNNEGQRNEERLRQQQEQSRRNDGRQGERRIEQMPRPQGWQGPRYPQNLGQQQQQQSRPQQDPRRSNEPQRQPQPSQPATPATPQAEQPPAPSTKSAEAPYGENDLFHTLRARREQLPEERRDERRDAAREGRARSRDDGHRPRIITDERGHAVGAHNLGKTSAEEPAEPRPAPVIIPVDDSSKKKPESHASGRSEAVTLSFAKKAPAEPEAPAAAETKRAAPAEEKAPKKAPAKKTSTKAKAVKEPSGDATEASEEPEAKAPKAKKKAAPKKKSEAE